MSKMNGEKSSEVKQLPACWTSLSVTALWNRLSIPVLAIFLVVLITVAPLLRGLPLGASMAAKEASLSLESSLLPHRNLVAEAKGTSDVTVLKVANWEEYIDEGGWDDDETITLDSGTITSEDGLVADFEAWYYETYGKQVKVEYSTYGTNEDLYSQLTLGDTFDLVCPSEYMMMKLMKEDLLQPMSDRFFDSSVEYNYYTRGVSPYIEDIFSSNEINGKPWGAYMAGYMWGVIGIVYNPEEVSDEDASTWSILTNPAYRKQVTIKDSAREAYFPVLAIMNKDRLLSDEFRNSPDYHEKLAAVMNDTSAGTMAKAEPILREIRQNVYSFETESGKADMVTGKVVANLQWSGDGAYTLDQAEADDYYLKFAVPKECTNLWFDGWVMLKSGIKGDAEKQQAAEAFINFLSRPDNVVRNMYYVGYTSVISGGDDPQIFDYVDYCYGAEEGDTIRYPLGYFFSGDDSDEDYVITAPADQAQRQLFAQYPPLEVFDRSAVMLYFPDDVNAQLNQMWINVRCFNFDQVSGHTWMKVILVLCLIGLVIAALRFRRTIFRRPAKRGFYRSN